jgi:photosystem II stability/assembly factor-like uncharacterized protein
MKLSILILLFSIFTVTSLFSQNFTWEWQNSKPFGFSLQQSIILNDGTIILFGEKSTILRSTNNGISWSRSVPDSATGERYIYSASFVSNTTGYFCGQGGMIAKTTDGGLTWNMLNSGVTANLLEISFYDENYGFAGGSSAVLLKTTDGGQNWTPYSTGTTTGEIYRIVFAPGSNGSTVYIGSGVTTIGRLSKSTDFGNTWNPAPGYSATVVVRGVAFTDANNGYIANGTYQILKTTDGGETFNLSHNPGTGAFYDLKIGSDGIVYVAGARGEVYKTTDQGTTWTQSNIQMNVTINTIAVKANLVIAAATGGIISKSTDAGTTWALASQTATVEELRSVKFVNSTTGFAVGGTTSAGVILKTTNSGDTWSSLPFTADYRFRSQYWFNENTGFVGKRGQYGLYKTTDGGLTFDSVNAAIGTTQNWNVISFANADTGYIAGDNGNFCRTTDGGATWTVIPNTAHHSTSIIYDISVIDAKTVVSMGASGKVFKTTDGGVTFTNIVLGTTNAMYGMDFYGENLGFIVGSSGRIYKTTNGGLTWSFTTPLGTGLLYSVKIISENIVWVTGSSGVVGFSTDGGTSWTTSTSFPLHGITLSTRTMYSLEAKGAYLWVAGGTGTIIRGYSDPIPVELVSFSATAGKEGITLYWNTATETNNSGFEIEQRKDGQVWENIGFVTGNGTTTLPSGYTFNVKVTAPGKYTFRLKQIDYDGTYSYSPEVEIDAEGPVSYTLTQNYPNPFNPSTTINFIIPVKEYVTLRIYDILGNLVTELLAGEKEAGSYTVNFDASKISSGVYLYELKAGSFTSARKMLLMK